MQMVDGGNGAGDLRMSKTECRTNLKLYFIRYFI